MCVSVCSETMRCSICVLYVVHQPLLFLITVPAGILLFSTCTKCVVAENRLLLLPVIFPYGDCENTHTLQELSLHLRTVECSYSKTGHYFCDHSAAGYSRYLQRHQSFYSPDAVVIFSPDEDTYVPQIYCSPPNVSGIVVRVNNVLDVASIGTFVAPHYLQSLAIFSYAEEEESDTFRYHILQGLNQPNEKSAFTIATLYDYTRVTIRPSRDLTAIRNGGLPLVMRANDNIWDLSREQEVVMWLEMLDCISSETLTGTIITSNKPIAVYTAKAECSGLHQFSKFARTIHQIPPPRDWGRLFMAATTAFQFLDSFRIALYLVCDTDSTVQIVWYYGSEGDNATTNETYTLTAAVAQTVTTDGSNITHFSVTSKRNLLVVYEIYNIPNDTNETKIYSSVLLQPVKWFSRVQSIYRYPLHGNMEGQHHCISVLVQQDDFDPRRIQLISKHTNVSQAIYYSDTLHNFSSYYTLYEAGEYVLIHLDITAAGLDADEKIVHSIQHKNMKAKLGATVYSVGGSQGSGLSYSNGYVRNGGRQCVFECSHTGIQSLNTVIWITYFYSCL